MKHAQRIAGIILALVAVLLLFPMRLIEPLSAYREFITIIAAYLLSLVLPGLLIDLVFAWLGNRAGEDIAGKCGGLRYGGYLIGYVERSLIFLAVLIAQYDPDLSFASVLSFLSVIVAAKAIFRYSNRETENRACGDWYILGTLMSITMALAFTWIASQFLFIW
ncbi:hypothetical protein EU538_09845 [Candidatus Thorarchaeota archaeon]|nr:MAG: hypothetical protein EU538_09845 [Candidatus Thorarchaeota archaeon]